MKTVIVALLTISLVLTFAPFASTAEPDQSQPSKDAVNTPTAVKSEATRPSTEVDDAIALLKKTDPNMLTHFDKAYGYVVFPAVLKGAIGIGAAHGKGVAFEQGARVGTAELTQGTMGAQLGGQEYIEVIFFENKEALDEFKSGKFTMAAQASVVAAASGASADAKYDHGVLVFTLAKTGLMFEASVGGQKFKFCPETQTAAR